MMMTRNSIDDTYLNFNEDDVTTVTGVVEQHHPVQYFSQQFSFTKFPAVVPHKATKRIQVFRIFHILKLT